MDQTAFSDFYRRTSRSLWSYVYRVTGNTADADDIAQEAFCRLLGRGPDADEEQWRRYLFRIASNLVVGRWRRQKRNDDGVREHLSLPLTSDAPGHEDVARTFARLTPRARALLWLAYVEGQSHEEIATSLGLARRSVKVLLFRARRRLRDLLESVGMVTRAAEPATRMNRFWHRQSTTEKLRPHSADLEYNGLHPSAKMKNPGSVLSCASS